MRVGSAITFCILKSSKSLSKFFVLDVIKMDPGLFWASNMQQFKSPRTKICLFSTRLSQEHRESFQRSSEFPVQIGKQLRIK